MPDDPPTPRRLQLPWPPRGLSRLQAAAYIGISASTFDLMVQTGRMPPPKRIGSRRVWDRHALDAAFDDLPDAAEPNPWDEDPDAGALVG